VVAELGPRAERDYQDMVAGKLLVPPPNAFAPCFKRVHAIEGKPFETGFDVTSLASSPRIIRGVVPGSAAALAGLRDGDTVVEAPDLGDPTVRDASKPVDMKVRRGDQTVAISFVPEGKPVMGYHWVRNEKVSDADCVSGKARF
jgi:predicted metalloprotease with PDZ domain